MDDGEFNLSNTIGIGLNIGEQMLLPVSNGEEEAQLALQQQQQQHLHEHQQQQEHHHQQQQAHYISNLNIEHHQPTENVNNTAETTTNVTCLDNSIGNFYQENTDLEDLNAKLAETTKILEYTPVEKPIELLTNLQEENREKAIVEELGSIAKQNEHQKKVEDEKINEDDEEEEVETEDKEDNEDEEEDVEEIEAEDVEAEEEEVEEVEEEDEVEEEIIPDEVIVPENTEDKIKEIQNNENKESDKETKDKDPEEIEDEEGDEGDAEENEGSQDNDDEESEQPTSSIRAARRKEEHVDEDQCRVCCVKDNLVSIFKKVEERTVAEMLMTICPSVSIAIKDFLPQYICNTCCDNVVIAIKLKTQCETTEKELRKKLSRHKNKIRRPVGYVVIDAPLDSDPPTDEEANDEEFKVSDIASATPSEDSETSDFSDSKKKRTRGRKRRKSAVVTPTDGKKSKTKGKSDDQSSDEDEEDGDPIKQKRKRSSNSSPENFACNECGQTFSRKQSLVLHKRQHVYDRGEPIKCEVCGKKFKIKGAYRTHLEKHREERRANKCTQCSRRFSSSSDLKRHIAEEHREKSILPTCSKCNRTFSSAGRLQRHKQNVCSAHDSSKIKKSETHAFAVGTDLFKAVAPLQSTYWSDSFSD